MAVHEPEKQRPVRRLRLLQPVAQAREPGDPLPGELFRFRRDRVLPEVFQENQANGESWGDGGALYRRVDGGPGYLVDCTLVRNRGVAYAGGIYCLEGSSVIVENTIIAFGPSGRATFCAGGSTITIACSDVIGNLGGDWSGCIADQANINGNFSADPLFCDPENGDFTIRSDSPCAPPGVTGCGLVGALPVGCGPVALEEVTWGAIKEKYRGTP
jgi:hypothetical protein